MLIAIQRHILSSYDILSHQICVLCCAASVRFASSKIIRPRSEPKAGKINCTDLIGWTYSEVAARAEGGSRDGSVGDRWVVGQGGQSHERCVVIASLGGHGVHGGATHEAVAGAEAIEGPANGAQVPLGVACSAGSGFQKPARYKCTT